MNRNGNRIGRTSAEGYGRWPCVAVCAVIAVLACGALVRAHEVGTTRVAVRFPEGRSYDIEIVTDAPSLAEKLDAMAGLNTPAPPTSELSPVAFGERLSALDDVFRRRIKVAFDGSDVHPAITYAVTAAADATSPVLATIRLTGEIPRGARHFTWLYSWTFSTYAFIVQSHPSGTPTTEWLEGGQPSTAMLLTAPPSLLGRVGAAWRYLTLGFTHIVPRGLDHMLFVFGLFLVSGRLRTALWQVSAFTVAHSITVGLSLYGLVTVPPSVVGPLVAVSIAYVAIENLMVTELKPWRIAPVFAFGLFHGLGIAGALTDLGLPRSEFPTALLAFNAGVQAGQMAVIAAAVPVVRWLRNNRDWYRRRAFVAASMLSVSRRPSAF